MTFIGLQSTLKAAKIFISFVEVYKNSINSVDSLVTLRMRKHGDIFAKWCKCLLANAVLKLILFLFDVLEKLGKISQMGKSF